MKAGIPATYTIEEAYNFDNNIEEEPKTTTTPLHILASHVPDDVSDLEMKAVSQMFEVLFEYGAGWCLTDIQNETPGCILVRRNMKGTPLFQQIVDAGVRAELLLRQLPNVEFIDDGNVDDGVAAKSEKDDVNVEEDADNVEEEAELKRSDPAFNQEAFLESKLEYKDGALVTTLQDGVMMDWESGIMRKACESLFKNASGDSAVLNIGFGMGIIDSMIQEKKPTKHYICEAHPDVLQQMRKDGWFEKENVVVLEGRWQDTLNVLLSQGVFFDGIYYDTFSEHYSDMLDLFDFVVGLLKPEGVFSFFNGLGGDRETIYEVYTKLVEIDLADYGLKVEFTDLPVGAQKMEGMRTLYWQCPVFHHPEATFM